MLIVMMDMDIKRYIHVRRLLLLSFFFIYIQSLCICLCTDRTYQILLMIPPFIAMQNSLN